jgi:hypothetical protein
MNEENADVTLKLAYVKISPDAATLKGETEIIYKSG